VSISILRNNSAKGRKIVEIFPKLYVSRSERCVVCYKILELKGNFCLREKNILMIVSYGKKLSEIYSLFYNLLPIDIFIN
jgi:hypothetical protein